MGNWDTVGNWGTSISGMGNWGSSSNWSSCISSYWNLRNSMDWSMNSLGYSLDSVGACFMDNWLVDSLVSTDWSSDGLSSIGGDVLEDGLGNVMGLDNWGGLVGGNGGRDVGVSSFSNGVGQGGDLGNDLSESMSLSSGVGKVATQSVVLDGSRVMGRGTD